MRDHQAKLSAVRAAVRCTILIYRRNLSFFAVGALGVIAAGVTAVAPSATAENVKPTPQIPSQPPGFDRKSPPEGAPQSKPPAKPDSARPDCGRPPGPDTGADARAGRPDRTSLPHPSTLKTAAQRKKALADLYERLIAADSAESAETVAESIEQMWLHSGSDTTNLLMERALEALHGKKPDVAIKLLDGVLKLQPGYAEAWNRRAYVHFSQKEYGKALLDLRHVLAIEPRHFKAINGLATILREFGDKRGALKAYRMLVEVHPFDTDAQQAIKELEREVEGESL